MGADESNGNKNEITGENKSAKHAPLSHDTYSDGSPRPDIYNTGYVPNITRDPPVSEMKTGDINEIVDRLDSRLSGIETALNGILDVLKERQGAAPK
jgi:hypothetical protein